MFSVNEYEVTHRVLLDLCHPIAALLKGPDEGMMVIDPLIGLLSMGDGVWYTRTCSPYV